MCYAFLGAVSVFQVCFRAMLQVEMRFNLSRCISCHMASMWYHGTYLGTKSQQLFCFILTRVRALAQMLIKFQNTEF